MCPAHIDKPGSVQIFLFSSKDYLLVSQASKDWSTPELNLGRPLPKGGIIPLDQVDGAFVTGALIT